MATATATAAKPTAAKKADEGPVKISQLLTYHNGLLALGEDGSLYRVDVDRGKFEGRASRAKAVVFRKFYPEEPEEKAADASDKAA